MQTEPPQLPPQPLSSPLGTSELQTICCVVTPTSPEWIEDSFSSCSTVCGVTAWILRFLNNIQACKKQTHLNFSVFHFLDELKTAEYLLYCFSEDRHFADKRHCLLAGDSTTALCLSTTQFLSLENSSQWEAGLPTPV